MKNSEQDKVINIVLRELPKNASQRVLYISYNAHLAAENINITSVRLQEILHIAKAKKLLNVELDLIVGSGLMVNITDDGILLVNQYGNYISYLSGLRRAKRAKISNTIMIIANALLILWFMYKQNDLTDKTNILEQENKKLEQENSRLKSEIQLPKHKK